jgi:uncharacterized protein
MPVQMAVRLVNIDPQGGPCAVYLQGANEAGESVFLPIVIGRNEAIALAMTQQKTPRPLSHDLLATIISQLGGTVRHISIDSVKDGIFFAAIHVAIDGDVKQVDSRPSDAVNLAVRAGVPILVSDEVMRESAVVSSDPENAAQGSPESSGPRGERTHPENEVRERVSDEALGPFRDVLSNLDLSRFGEKPD